MVHSPNVHTDFFDIVTVVLQGDTLSAILVYLLWLPSSNVKRSN